MNINGRDCDSYQVTVTGPSGHKQGWKLEFMLLIGRTLAVLINPIPVTHLLDQSKPGHEQQGMLIVQRGERIRVNDELSTNLQTCP